MANVVTYANTAPVVQTVAPAQYRGEKYAQTYKVLGIVQLILGSVSILFAIICLGIVGNSWDPSRGLTSVSSGLWGGVLFVVAGALGIYSSKIPEPCQINAAMSFAILASIAAGLMMSIEGAAASYAMSSSRQSIYALHVLMALIGATELVVGIVHASLCCAVTCCSGYTPPVVQNTTTITTTTIPGTVQPQPMAYNPGAYQPGPITQQVVYPAGNVPVGYSYPQTQIGYTNPPGPTPMPAASVPYGQPPTYQPPPYTEK